MTKASRGVTAPVRTGLRRIRTAAKTVADLLRPSLTVLRGKDRNTGEPLSIAHAGAMPRNYRLGFPGQVLHDIDEEIDAGRHWLWRIRGLATAHDCSFVLVESPSVLRALIRRTLRVTQGCYFLPFFVNATSEIADLPGLLQGNETLKADLRRVRREKLWYRISTDPEDFRRFLDGYHRPYLEAAHGSFAMVFDYGFLYRGDEASRRNWELLQVMADDDWVAGILIRKSRDRADQIEAGVSQAHFLDVRRGALAASYWFGVQRARELGYSTAGFMWAPPFLANGVLRMKSKYHPWLRPAPSKRSGTILVRLKWNEQARRILLEQPFLQLKGDKLTATAFVRHPDEIDEARGRLSRAIARFHGVAESEVVVIER